MRIIFFNIIIITFFPNNIFAYFWYIMITDFITVCIFMSKYKIISHIIWNFQILIRYFTNYFSISFIYYFFIHIFFIFWNFSWWYWIQRIIRIIIIIHIKIILFFGKYIIWIWIYSKFWTKIFWYTIIIIIFIFIKIILVFFIISSIENVSIYFFFIIFQHICLSIIWKYFIIIVHICLNW